MNTQIQVFSNPEFGQIRTTQMPDGQIGFVGKDVAKVLGYSNATKAIIMHVEEDDKVMLMTEAQSQNGTLVKTRTAFINESGLYALILSSKLPKAREFKHWVTSEVLPQIRRTGGYIPLAEGDDEKALLHSTISILRRTVEMQRRSIGEQRLELVEQDQQIARLAPKARYAEEVLLSPTCYTMTEVAKSLSMTVQQLQQTLHDKRIIYRSPSGTWMLYAPHLHKGYEAYRTSRGRNLRGQVLRTDSYLVWTERGREFIHAILRPYLPSSPQREEAA